MLREVMKRCLVSRITTFPLDERFAVSRGWRSCMRAMRWPPTTPALALPTPHRRGWRRAGLPGC